MNSAYCSGHKAFAPLSDFAPSGVKRHVCRRCDVNRKRDYQARRALGEVRFTRGSLSYAILQLLHARSTLSIRDLSTALARPRHAMASMLHYLVTKGHAVRLRPGLFASLAFVEEHAP